MITGVGKSQRLSAPDISPKTTLNAQEKSARSYLFFAVPALATSGTKLQTDLCVF
jgi:hypothetical protein